MLSGSVFVRRSCGLYMAVSRYKSDISYVNFEAHGFDHEKNRDRNRTLKPDKLRITIPVPVQNRALKRHRNPKVIAKEADRERMKHKKVIISSKRPEFNHRKAETYGKFDKIPLVSGGWNHRKSIGDYFTINPFQPLAATNFDDTHPTFERYKTLGLDPRLIEALAKCGFTKSTNIQHEAIPRMLEYPGSNTLIAAETGNGKTLAFLVPMLNQLLYLKDMEETPQLNAPYGVIVTPGRELADQIGAVVDDLCSHLGLRSRVHVGGQIRRQIVSGPRDVSDIIVGTMGGLSKLFHEGYLKRNKTSMLAVDEIDTMLDDTFKDDLISFIRKFGMRGQSLATGVTVLMAGATFPTNFDNYLSGVMDPEDVLKVSTDNIHRVLYHIPQKFMKVGKSKKTQALLELLDNEMAKNKKIIIFSNKASTSDFVQIFLNENKIDCINFNGSHHYKYRRDMLDRFVTGEVKVMSCTDLISRGIDTHDVSHIINYDFPLNPADYIHRVGRVGRVGGLRDGKVTSFVSRPAEVKVLQNIETAVRKNTEIRQVNNNIIRIIQHRVDRKEKHREIKL